MMSEPYEPAEDISSSSDLSPAESLMRPPHSKWETSYGTEYQMMMRERIAEAGEYVAHDGISKAGGAIRLSPDECMRLIWGD